MQLRCVITTVVRVPCCIALIAILTASASLPAAAEPKATFMARCGNCHGLSDIQYWGRRHADAAARETWLDQFLRRHYPPSESERALIINYIQSTITDQSAR